MSDRHATLHFVCGKLGSGKTTLAREIAVESDGVFISEDVWLSRLFPGNPHWELHEYLDRSARFRAAIAPQVTALLAGGISVVLDFAGNVPDDRQWVRSLFEEVRAEHLLHFLDVPDAICKERLRRRNADLPEGAQMTSDEEFDAISKYFVPPSPDEGFLIREYRISHESSDPRGLSAMQMNNPWLNIPAGDYIGHMSSPEVAQYQVLNHLFREILASTCPRSLLVLGCAIGNGFEHIDPAVTSRVVGVDMNAAYLQRLGEQFPHPPFRLDLQCRDLSQYSFEPAAFDLVHAALILEYVDWSLLLPRMVATVKPRGALNVVLQLPSRTGPAVTPTAFTSLRALETIFRFVDPDALTADATALGLHLDSRRTERLESAKAFEVLRFRRL